MDTEDYTFQLETEKFLDLDMLLHKNDKIIKNNENSKNNMVERLENLRK